MADTDTHNSIMLLNADGTGEEYSGSSGTSGSNNKALIKISAIDYASETVTLTNGTDTYTDTLSTLGVANIYVKNPGVYVATVNGEEIGSVNVDVYTIDSLKKVKFAFHYSENDSDPDSVTYPEGYDNYGWTPAHMDFENGVFDYGDWNPEGANADKLRWFYPKSCMLKYDCTVDYYLDEDDLRKKVDGTESDVANMDYAGNAMMEWGQDGCMVWWKIVTDADGKGFTFVVANHQADDAMHAWNHYDCDGNLVPHFYLPKYFGSTDGTRLRSMAKGTSHGDAYVNSTREDEVKLALANNLTSKVEYYTEVHADYLLITMLTWMLVRSLAIRSKIGNGRVAGQYTPAYGPGSYFDVGMFRGYSDGTNCVVAWGMQNLWGNLNRVIAGRIIVDGIVKSKLTYSTVDGSTTVGYNLDGTGYVDHGVLLPSGTNGGFVSHMRITERGITPLELSGSASTRYTTSANYYNSGTFCTIAGGAQTVNGIGMSYFSYIEASGKNNWTGTALSCKPHASRYVS